MAHTFLRSGFTGLPKMYTIDSSVGLNRANLMVEVMLIQLLLKIVNVSILAGNIPVAGTSLIKVDGYYGPQTKLCIKAFENDLKGRFVRFDQAFDPLVTADGSTTDGLIYKIVVLNKRAKDRNESRYNFLASDKDAPPLLKRALSLPI